MCNQPDRKKEIAILSSVALLFFVGYYYICMMPVGVSREIRIVSSSALMGVCLFGSFFLLADSRGLRAHRVFALQMLLTGLAAGFSVARILVQSHTTPVQPLSPGILMYGNAYAFIMLLHPFELLYPKQMTVGKYFRLFLPALLTGLAYYGYSTVTGYRPGESGDWWDLLINIRDFGVWLRIALLLYPFWLFGLILRQWRRYIIWCRRNFSNTNYTELSWLNYYLFGYFLILISYMIVVTACNSQSLLSHSLCFLMFVGFTLYRILRQGAPDLPELIENTPPPRMG